MEKQASAHRNGGLTWYTDESKINDGTCTGGYGYDTRKRFHFSLGQELQYSRQKDMPSRFVQ
jgi:hypothetical protein